MLQYWYCSAGLDPIDYFEKRFPDLDKMPTSGDNANCAEWLLSITTKVPYSTHMHCYSTLPSCFWWIEQDLPGTPRTMSAAAAVIERQAGVDKEGLNMW